MKVIMKINEQLRDLGSQLFQGDVVLGHHRKLRAVGCQPIVQTTYAHTCMHTKKNRLGPIQSVVSYFMILTAKTLETLPILKIELESGGALFPLTLTPTPPFFSTVPL